MAHLNLGLKLLVAVMLRRGLTCEADCFWGLMLMGEDQGSRNEKVDLEFLYLQVLDR